VPVPDDPALAVGLILVAAIAILAALYSSGVSWRIILSSPRTWFRSIVAASVHRGQGVFWFVWILLSVAIVLILAGTLIFIGIVS